MANSSDGELARRTLMGQIVVPPNLTEASSPEVGTIISGEIEVRLASHEEFITATAGFALQAGQVLRVTRKEPAEFTLGRRVDIVLDADAEVIVAPETTRPLALKLKQGRLFAEVQAGTPFRVLSDHGEVNCLGTKFAVSLARSAGRPPEFMVSVEERLVQIQKNNVREFVGAGESLVLQHGHRARREGQQVCRSHLSWVHSYRTRQQVGESGRSGHPGGTRGAKDSAMIEAGGKLYVVSGATLARLAAKTLALEARVTLDGLGRSPKQERQERAAWISHFDENKDGVLNETDVRVWRWLRRFDRNGDGQVGPEEASIPAAPGASGPVVLEVVAGHLVMLRSGMLFKFDLETLKLVASEAAAPPKPGGKNQAPCRDKF